MIATRTTCRRFIPLLASLCCVPANAFEMEMGSVTVNDTFTTPTWTGVAFQQAFDTTPVVFVLPTNQGGDPATLRIRNVTTTGFEVVVVERPIAVEALGPFEIGGHGVPEGLEDRQVGVVGAADLPGGRS